MFCKGMMGLLIDDIKDWFKAIFSIFLTLLLCKVSKTNDQSPPSDVISEVM